MVPTGGAQLQRPLRGVLAGDLGEVAGAVGRRHGFCSAGHRRQGRAGAAEPVDELAKRLRGAHLDAGDERGLGGIAGGDHNSAGAAALCAQHGRQHTGHGAQSTVEPEPGDPGRAGHHVGGHPIVGREHGHRDREVEAGAHLAHVGGQ